ncbi:MAG: Gfo/Idh/MocA family oxidoreductase [Lewinellaceae bacterium]|nr:Gfo/Idh/MocA family oxidoreductase [Lewinellaceae bacterium]
MKKTKDLTRREFIKAAAVSGIGLTVVPAKVLGGTGRAAPSDKINVALIGCGTQALKMLPDWLQRPELQFVSVCDPNRESYDYPLWGKSKGEKKGAPGGREVGRARINEFYAENAGKAAYKGCTAYADFRELLEKEKGVDAVFIMTPDHLHATVAAAAMKKGIMVGSHKPVGNFMHETRVVCEMAKQTKISYPVICFSGPERTVCIKRVDSPVP